MKYLTNLVLRLGLLAAVLFSMARYTGVASAQSEGPAQPASEPVSWQGAVVGQVENMTNGEEVKQVLSVMLHAWDAGGQEKVMLHGESAADGSYQFTDVLLNPSFTYAVMATYQDVAYYSTPGTVTEGQENLQLDANVYEVSSDLTAVSISQQHVLFYFDKKGLSVTEVYILSNNGNTTVKGGVALDSGRKGSLKLPLPENATNVQFNTRAPDRFIQLAGGFVDTQPLLPGEETSQIMVNYSLPYEGNLEYSFTAPVTVEKTSWLIQEGIGITLEGSDLELKGTQPMGQGLNFVTYDSGSLTAGEQVAVSLRGNSSITASSPELSAPAKKTSNGLPLIAAGFGLGLALFVSGLWWWKKSQNVPADLHSSGELETIVTQNAVLDQTNQAGEVTGEENQARSLPQ